MVVGDFLGIVSGEAEAETNPKVMLVLVDVELELLDGIIAVVDVVVWGVLVIVMVLLAETIVVELVNMAVLLAETIVVEFVNIGPDVVMVLFAEVIVLEFVGEAEKKPGPGPDVIPPVGGSHVTNEVKTVPSVVTVKLIVVAGESQTAVSVGAAKDVSVFRELGHGMGHWKAPFGNPRTASQRCFPSARLYAELTQVGGS